MSEKKKTTKKKKEVVVEEQVIETPVIVEEPVVEPITSDVIEDVKEEVVNLEALVEETINEELKVEEQEKEFRVSPLFTTEEKLFITKMVANGYRPFDIVKKARMSLKLSEEKMQRLSLNIRTVEQLVKALEE